MKSTLLITLCTLFTSTLFAQSRSQDLREIRNLSYQIEQETYSTRGTPQTLRNVKSLLRRALNELQNGGTNPGFAECRQFAFPILDRTLPASDAMDEAIRLCRQVEALPEMKFLFEKYDRTLPASDALERAATASDFSLVDKLDLLEFAFEKYDRTLATSTAADRAVQGVSPIQNNRNPGGTLSCFKKTYPVYDRTLPSAEAMDRTIQACR